MPQRRPAAPRSSSPGRRPVRAADAPAAGSASPLVGDYARTGATLRRPDGRALVVCQSTKRTLGPRDAARFVRTVAPGSAIRYAGNLYPPTFPGRDDLDGAEFQDGPAGPRYAVALAAPGVYAVRALSPSVRGLRPSAR